ncbi:carbohydrate ABC transporter permease [Massiliimalia massiliensis]|uniref:carbohydrate ABC transporter permease n=1 Tax=Massiliimalia massiliensis TaxID=1852384 RepID=UPI000986D718|nr:carbohydrate ABC transporter permease [Massiliimalia massiliensis]
MNKVTAPIGYVAKIGKFIFLTVFAILALFPFYWMLVNSFRSNDQIYSNALGFPEQINFDNFVRAWQVGNIGTYFFNTLFVSVVAVALILVISAMAAYVLAKVWNSKVLYLLFSLGLMIPAHTIIVPLFSIFNKVGLTNNFLSIILSYLAMELSLSIFILKGFMVALPKELDEAATIDGCSRTGAFFRVILPISLPGLATVGILAFLFCWNEFLIPLVLITKSEMKMLSQGIQDLNGQYVSELGVMFAGVVMMALPVVVVYLIFQEQVIRGMVAGAVKG